VYILRRVTITHEEGKNKSDTGLSKRLMDESAWKKGEAAWDRTKFGFGTQGALPSSGSAGSTAVGQPD